MTEPDPRLPKEVLDLGNGFAAMAVDADLIDYARCAEKDLSAAYGSLDEMVTCMVSDSGLTLPEAIAGVIQIAGFTLKDEEIVALLAYKLSSDAVRKNQSNITEEVNNE